MTLGQSFGAFATAVETEMKRLDAAAQEFLVINMGATAIGTGITAEPGYGMHYVQPAEPVHGRYVRYAVPSGAPKNGVNTDNVYCCNIAEIELYGTVHTAEPVRLKGDVDANGKVEIADAVMLLKYLLTSGDVTDAEAADMNEDGVLSVTDLTLLKAKLLG